MLSLLLASALAADLHSLDVTPPARPTPVEVSLHLLDLTHVSPPSEPFPTFRAEVWMTASWHDPRLLPPEPLTETEIFQGHAVQRFTEAAWWPDLGIHNEEGARKVEHQEIALHPDGRVLYEERFAVQARAHLDLRRFPFDDQSFHLQLTSFTWEAPDLELKLVAVDHDPEVPNLEWTLRGVRGTSSTLTRPGSGEAVSTATLWIDVTRQPGFYLYKLLVPLILIVITTWSAFFLRGESSSARMQRTFLSLLTVVAFHHIIASHLPHIPYLTFVDAVVYAAFIATTAVLVQIIRIHNAERAGDGHRVRALERSGQILHPLGFFALLVGLWIVIYR